MLNDYEKQLRQTNLADNTIVSYCHSLKQYLKMYENVFTKKNLLSFKGFLIENYSPKTVNLRILAINKYLEFNKLDKLKLKMIKVQQKTYLENVISDADYKFFKNKLKKDGRLNGILLSATSRQREREYQNWFKSKLNTSTRDT